MLLMTSVGGKNILPQRNGATEALHYVNRLKNRTLRRNCCTLVKGEAFKHIRLGKRVTRPEPEDPDKGHAIQALTAAQARS